MKSALISLTLLFVVGSAGAADKPAGIPDNYKLLYASDFSKPDSIKDFLPTDADAWRLGTAGGKSFFEQHKQSNYKPTHRSPFNFALLSGKVFGDCIIDVEGQQTSKEYGHRDMVFVFGYQNPSQFYYVHIATKSDDHANNVFIVKDAPRLKISKESNAGNDWGMDAWKKVRIERKVSDGTIKVYFENLSKPIMLAEDKSFGPGWIGVGTFDDTARVADLKVWGEKAEDKQVPPFNKK